MGHFIDECYANKKKKGKEEKVNVIEETQEELALIIVVHDEHGEVLIQGEWFIW